MKTQRVEKSYEVYFLHFPSLCKGKGIPLEARAVGIGTTPPVRFSHRVTMAMGVVQ